MTPYLLHKTWIDLDHVIAIESKAHVSWPPAGAAGYPPWSTVGVVMAFRNDSIFVNLGSLSLNEQAGTDPEGSTAQPIIDAFIAAWKERGQVVIHCGPSKEWLERQSKLGSGGTGVEA